VNFANLFLLLSPIAAAFVIQLIWWNFRAPKRQTYFTLILFVSVGVFSWLYFAWTGTLGSFLEHFYFLFFYFSATLAYAISFTAIEGTSPSGLILVAIEKARGRGLTMDEVHRLMTNEMFFGFRLEELLSARYIEQKDGCYFITKKGRCFLNVFRIPRRLLLGEKSGG
jgi:hypothetical protein